MMNTPIVEGLIASRFAVSCNKQRGYVYNSYRDEYWSNQDAFSFLGGLRITPTDELTIDSSGSWSRARSRSRGGECVFVQPTDLGALAPDLYPAWLDG